MLQRQPVQKFHGDECLPVLLANVMDRADVGMIQGGSRLRFTLEAAESLRVLGNFFGQEFQGDEAVQLYVLGFVDDTHPAAAEFFDDAIMGNRLANKRIELGTWQHILGCARNQVNEGTHTECGLS